MLSAEFLDATRFPEVRWVVSEFEGDATRAIAARGELTIHGHTQAVEATGRIGLPGPGLLSRRTGSASSCRRPSTAATSASTGRRRSRAAATPRLGRHARGPARVVEQE